jgi:hypothetical protein
VGARPPFWPGPREVAYVHLGVSSSKIHRTDMSDSKSDDLVWGARAIGEEINRKDRQVYYMAERGILPVTKAGEVLVGKRSDLRDPSRWPRRGGKS